MPKGTRLDPEPWSCLDCGEAQDLWTTTGPHPHRCLKCRPAHRTRLARKALTKAGPEKAAEYQARYRAKRLGITDWQRQALVTRANGRCEVCGASEPLHLDHDHETGKARGMLCRPCNLALGQMVDSPWLLRAAAAYLERNGTSGRT